MPTVTWPSSVEPAAEAQDRGDRDRREEVDEGEVEAVQDDGLLVRVAVAVVDRPELALVRLLARERLDDAHAGDVLGERGGDQAEALAHGAVRARRAPAEDAGRDGHQREHGEGRQREAPVEHEQDHRRADEHERVLEEARDSVGDELVEGLDVVREAADGDAGAVPLEVAERQALQVAEELVAQVGEDALARPAGEVGLRDARQEVGDARDDEEDDRDRERLEVPLADAVVDGDLREERRHERGQRRREERDDRERRPAAVGRRQARERRHPAHRLRPGPVADLRAALLGQVGAGLPDLHAPAASTRSENSRSSSPCS